MKKKNIFQTGIFLSILFGLIFPLGAQEDLPQTVAESSQFTATSRYVDVMAFIHRMQELSPYLRVETLGVSPEGREIPLVIVGDPVPATPLQLKYDSRIPVYIQANIHAGEVEGKEASLMLIRDILTQEKPPYLEDLVLLFAPIFNIDGNEKIDPQNRRNQAGPEQGVGVRYNGQNLDLNRDSMKMESPELQGMVRNVLRRWDPVILVDCHTTNGSYHQNPVTYSWPLNPNGSREILMYMRDTMMPALKKHLKEKYDTLCIPYGNFMGRDMSGWRTFSHQPRFVTNYVGLRNRLAILIENYAHAEYKTRVWGNYYYVKSIFDYCRDNKDVIRDLIREADRKTVARGKNPDQEEGFAVEFEVKPLKEPITILGYEMEIQQTEGGRPRMRRSDTPKTYTLPYHADFQPQRSVAYPVAYLIGEQVPMVVTKLKQHGIVVERLLKTVTLEVESFHVSTIEAAGRLYQGHRMNSSVKGEYRMESRAFPEGSLVVRTAQPLANLAAYLLEPESDDGLLVWNFFDRYLVPQWRNTPQIYPVHKLYGDTLLVTEVIR